MLRRFALQDTRVTIGVLSHRLTDAPIGESTWQAPLPAALRRSAALLGAARVELFDMPEPPLALACRITLQGQLADLIRVERPEIVISSGGALRTAAVDRRAALALVDGAIVAAATAGYEHQPGAPNSPCYEVPERWLFVSHDAAAIAHGQAANGWDDPIRTRRRWFVFDATMMMDLKWRALGCYLTMPAVEHPPATLAQTLREERFLRVSSPFPAAPQGTRRLRSSKA